MNQIYKQSLQTNSYLKKIAEAFPKWKKEVDSELKTINKELIEHGRRLVSLQKSLRSKANLFGSIAIESVPTPVGGIFKIVNFRAENLPEEEEEEEDDYVLV